MLRQSRYYMQDVLASTRPDVYCQFVPTSNVRPRLTLVEYFRCAGGVALPWVNEVVLMLSFWLIGSRFSLLFFSPSNFPSRPFFLSTRSQSKSLSIPFVHCDLHELREEVHQHGHVTL